MRSRAIPMKRQLLAASCLALALSLLTFANASLFAPLGDGYGSTTTFQIVLGDLDGDGDLDAVFTNQGIARSRVLLNDGMGIFDDTDPKLTTQGHGADLGDLDSDGDLDLFILVYGMGGGPNVVWRNVIDE